MARELLPVAVITGATGLVGLLESEWCAAIKRQRRTSLPNTGPRRIELSDERYDLTKSVSQIFIVAMILLAGCPSGA